MDLDIIWKELAESTKALMSNLTYNTWIANLKPIRINEEELLVSAPNSYSKKMIETKYLDDLETYLNIIIEGYLGEEPEKRYKIRIIEPGEDEYEAKVSVEPKSGQQYFSYDDGETEEDRKKNIERIKAEQMLNPKYTFDTFVKGKSNDLALAAAAAVAKNPAKAYNPLFIYGGPGLGKTHLMQACAHAIIDNNPDARVVYLSSEKFTNELISSIGAKSTKKSREFRNKYRNIDVLLIDDIQFIAGKTGTQLEFFHTFNDLYSQNKQIVISSDRPPKEIETLEERLVSRFEWGLIADIQMPDYETRIAILKAKLKQENETLPMEILEYIAMNVKSNIRELEGALMTIIAYSSLMDEPIMTLDGAKKALENVITENQKRPITLDLIKKIIAENYGITLDDLSSKNRSKKIAYPRQIAMYLCRQMTDLSLIKIADAFNRDHSTVMHGVDKITNDMDENPAFAEEISELVKVIKNE